MQEWYGTLNTSVGDAFRKHHRGTPGVLAESGPDEAVDGSATGWSSSMPLKTAGAVPRTRAGGDGEFQVGFDDGSCVGVAVVFGQRTWRNGRLSYGSGPFVWIQCVQEPRICPAPKVVGTTGQSFLQAIKLAPVLARHPRTPMGHRYEQ